MTPTATPSARGDLARSSAAFAVTVAGTLVLFASHDGGVDSLIQLLAVMGCIMHFVAIVFGAAPLVGASLGPLLGAGMIAAAASQTNASWASIVVGCAWFVGAELAWEAIDRRDGVNRSASATRERLRDVTVVVGVSAGVAVIGVLGSAAPPVRTLPLQMLIALCFFAAALLAGRHLRGRTLRQN